MPLPGGVEVSPGLPAGVQAGGLQSVVQATRHLKCRHRVCRERGRSGREGPTGWECPGRGCGAREVLLQGLGGAHPQEPPAATLSVARESQVNVLYTTGFSRHLSP